MKNTAVEPAVQSKGSPPLYKPVQVSISFDPLLGVPVISVEKKYREHGPSDEVDPANMQLGSGLWAVHFELEPDSGLSFSNGPVLIGIEEPQLSVSNPIAFAVTRGSTTLRTLRFEFPNECGPTFQYAIRVHEATGANHMIDPKVINRGEPGPLPPLLKD